MDTCIATVLHRDNMNELNKLIGLSKQLGTRFMHFNYIPTGRAKAHVELDLTPNHRYEVLETIGKEIVGLYMQKKERKSCVENRTSRLTGSSAHVPPRQCYKRAVTKAGWKVYG